MAGCEPMTFHNVDAQVFNSLKGKLSGLGYSLEGIKGTVNGPYGIVLEYDWTEVDSALYIKVTEKNFLVPCSQIEKALTNAIVECGGK